MTMIRAVVTILLIFPGYLLADEDPACSTPDKTFLETGATELRQIAASCTDPGISRLFYNRAYNKDLLAEGKVLSTLETINDQSGYLITSYRLYIALIEEMATLCLMSE